MMQVSYGRLAASAAIVVAGGAALFSFRRPPHADSLAAVAQAANNPPHPGGAGASPVKVDVVRPNLGGMDRVSIQPGSIHAYESAELFAKVSGYLAKLHVDIGDRVTKGQLLVELDSPELHRDVDRGKAAVERAEAQVGQMKARVLAAEADRHAAETGIARAEAGLKRDQAAYEFRDKQVRRFRELVDSKSIDERLVDEKEDQRLAAQAAVDASQANLAESRALVASAAAKVEQSRADLVDALAEVDVTNANLAKAMVFAAYTKVTAPYDGVITSRAFHRGDFIRGAEQNAVQPLLTVERTDVVRLVVHVPDGDVPFTDPGDDTVTDIDALPGHKFIGKVSRIAFSEDKKSKTMRTEIDLPNDRSLLRNGMYGRTKLMLQSGNPHAYTVPSSALAGATKEGKGTLYLAKDGAAHKIAVTISADNGVLAEIIEGLTANDLVIVGNNNSIVDGRPIDVYEGARVDPGKKPAATD
jgi:HlyD family secretion protein